MTQSDPGARDRLQEAMARLASGERAALEEVYRATRVKLFGICLRILNDPKEAEDALQDVFVNLWQRADRFDPARASPISWLATLARNRAIDRLRRTGKHAGQLDLDAAFALADSAPIAEEAMIDAERRARIHHCLGELEDKQRHNIAGAFFGGATYRQLAERAGVPLGTMKSWVRRGLARLKQCLEAGE